MTKRSRFNQIGIDRLIRIDWLEKAAFLALAGNDVQSTRVILKKDIQNSFQSNRTDVRGSIDKTTTILLRVWVSTHKDLEIFRIKGLNLIKNYSGYNHLVIHWGMLTAVYPFWSVVAAHVGRLLKLQGSVTAAHVHRRLSEQYGDRETVSRRVRYVLRSFHDWGVIKETEFKGIYSSCKTRSIEDPRLISWLFESFLLAKISGSATMTSIIQSPSLFPFNIGPLHIDKLKKYIDNIEINSQGINDSLLILKSNNNC